MLQFIDTHSHLFLEEFDGDRPAVVQRAKEAGVSHIFMPNIDSTTIMPLKQMCADYPGYCYPLMGLHPTSVNEYFQAELDVVYKELTNHKQQYIGIGEIGIDLYWDRTFKQEQIQVFRNQVQWSIELDLPVVIHCRDAFDEIYAVLCEFDANSIRGIFHSFTAGEGEAERILHFPHFLFGINGIVTFKKSLIPEALKTIPVEKVVVETDSPYLAPVPCRGKRNESAYAKFTLERLAQIYEITVDKMACQTTDNVNRLFGFCF